MKEKLNVEDSNCIEPQKEGSENMYIKTELDCVQNYDGKEIMKLSFFDAILLGFKKIFFYKGRARRKEYWALWFAALLIIAIITFLLFTLKHKIDQEPLIFNFIGIIEHKITAEKTIHLIISITAIILLGSVSIRRLHDIGDSGWIYLIYAIPALIIPFVPLYIYFYWLVIFASILCFIFTLGIGLSDGNIRDNQYGKSPKYIPKNENSRKN